MPAQCVRRVIGLVAVACAALALAGCGGKPADGGDSVSGKVTLNGQPVAGRVAFVGADKKETITVTGPDGRYSIANLPKGELQVFVRSAALPKPVTPRGVQPPPGLPAAVGVAPPARYAQAKHAQKLTVTGGAQTFDIDLKP